MSAAINDSHFSRKHVLEYTNGDKSYKSASCTSLRSLAQELGSRYGEKFIELLLGGCYFFLVNGKGVMSTGGLDTPLKPGDRVEALPVVEAG
jgi:molybdopterin converting factor small subunit